MSSMVMTKDHDGNKRGDVVSVPFNVGRALIENGVARYLSDTEPLATPVIQQTPAIMPVVEQPKREPESESKKIEPAKYEQPEKRPFHRASGGEKHGNK